MLTKNVAVNVSFLRLDMLVAVLCLPSPHVNKTYITECTLVDFKYCNGARTSGLLWEKLVSEFWISTLLIKDISHAQ